MQPRAHSEERVEFDRSSVPSRCDYIADKLEELLQKYSSVDPDKMEEAEDERWSIARELFSEYGYGAYGDSNSVWGRQHRVGPQPGMTPEDKDKFVEAVRAFGFIDQEVPSDGHRDPGAEANIFVPDFRRYFSVTHEVNLPDQSVIVVRHTDIQGNLTHIEVLGKDSVLSELESTTNVDEDRREVGVLRYESETAGYFETALKSMDEPFSVVDGYTSSFPEYQWSPEVGEEGLVAVSKDVRMGSGTVYTVHAPKPRSTVAACGTELDDSEYNWVLPRSVEGLGGEWQEVDWCGHGACQSRF